MIEEQLVATFAKLLTHLQGSHTEGHCSSRQEVAIIKLSDGRRAQVTLKIDADEAAWMR